MSDDINVEQFDQLIDSARVKFRAMLDQNPALFGGEDNRARINATIGADAAKGTIGVPDGIDISTTQGLMAAVDLTELKPTATEGDIRKVAQRAHDESAATVCVYPENVALVQEVTGGNPPPIAVVGFPSVSTPGANETTQTLKQTCAAITSGAKEIDMVLPINFKDGNFKDGNPDYQAHYDYMRAVVEEANKTKTPVKVILETAYLNDQQKVEASMLAKMAGAEFVKTSTGFAKDELMRPETNGQKGATPHDVALMRRTAGDTTLTDDGKEIPMGVKASGGVRNREQAIAVYEAGASRIGASGGLDVRSKAEQAEAAKAAGSGPSITGDAGKQIKRGETTY